MEYIWCLLVTTICPYLSLLQDTNNPSTGELLSLITQLNQTLQTQSSILAFQNKTIAALETTVATQSKKITELEAPQVAFYAELDPQITLGRRQTIEFGHVVVNMGNAYDARHGHFVVPANGLYLFTVTIMKPSSGDNLHVELFKNGMEIGKLHNDASAYNQASIAAFVQLNTGDMVWARHMSGSPSEVMTGGHYSSFGGALISKL